ncbi:MAG: ATP-binding cassette domain-containing protein [Brasilonema octagenarum HA4186-MV1]|jgi:ATP-binding cassette subfamily B protein|uniref:ABC transporter ATP-binding protein n=1 Tax=Brasilonema octagenarum UFV-OR1 TaxID=417115 RepID=A0ABX1M137_9CYAN|nr:ABC transporter ATP-binding protein [Brasilonema octagenarum]MBW4630294.1 ATP-binding cassette domain-containing protein [Brasilonema octagenarum HA4186-MV1]NMF62210.1 ABC transporter ATP-binding protein [Brasilonema octagenarum UFV-OR1]
MQAGKILKQKLQNTLRFLPALRLVWQSSPSWTIARVVLLVIQGILPLVSIYLAKLIVDTVAASLNTGDKAAAFGQVLFLIVLAGVVTLVTTLCTSLTELVNTAHSQQVSDYMQGILQAKSIEADLEYYENPQYYDTLQRAQQEAPYRPPQILNRLAQVGQNSISLLAMVGLLLSLHWGIALMLFVAGLPSMLVRVKYTRVLYRWQRKVTPQERQSMYLAWMLTSDQFAKEIRLFNLGSYFSQWYLRIRRQIYKESLVIFTARSLANFAAQAVAAILMFAVLAFIVNQAIQGVLKLGDLVLYYQALQRGQNDIKGLLSSVSGLYEDNLFLANLYEFLDLKPKLVEPLHPVPIPRPMQSGIVFNHVSFQYSTTTRQALKDINLIIRPGEVVALVGENGSGKTSLIKLLCRLYAPTSGSITIDGIDLGQFKIAELRQEISVIFQDYAKYHFTAQENIWLGNIDLPPHRESIIAAARRSGADDVITHLPQGYDTILGKLFERGEELSIGQWQKIALARAFLRDSQVIVLDEPTSAMDPKAEYEVFEKFRQLIKNQAAILISHRLSTVKMADRIYVMANGSIVESGTHDELMQLGATYAHLFETQAQQYR